MNFTEFGFWPRLLVGLLLIGLIRFLIPKRPEALSLFDRISLSCLSLYLLWCVDILTFSIFLSLFLTAWGLLMIMIRLPLARRKAILAIGIPILCLPLLYYKYRVFVVYDILGWHKVTFTSLAIPAGISFYTFQKIAMLVDASRMESWKPKFIDYVNFGSFFPQVVAGPIERKSFLFPQMESFSFGCYAQRFHDGAPWLALGFFYKLCLADNLSPLIDPAAMYSAWEIAFTTLVFGLKIYFDFCGYSLIALGLARCIGIHITLNFRSPYWSANIREFWRRWHISLSYWFRDYVYIPLGGSMTRFWAVNLLIVFTLSGLWHGAGWGFILWGALHGVFTVVSHYFKGKIRIPWGIGWGLTLFCVFVAWLPFYDTNFSRLEAKMSLLASPAAWAPNALMELLRSLATSPTAVGILPLCLLALMLEGLSRYRKKEDYAHANHPLMIAACVFAVVFLGGLDSNEFVYFAF